LPKTKGALAVRRRAELGETVVSIQRLTAEDSTTLTNEGVRSVQIVWPENAPDAKATITRVTMEPGAISKRHTHPRSEQIWIVEQGVARLLMADDTASELRFGDIVRTPAGHVHGVENIGDEPFIYLSVTTPPQDFSTAYKDRKTT
jgi:quercetin dioxygenase-like cupin family protein